MNSDRIKQVLSTDLITKDVFAGMGCVDMPLPPISKIPAVVILNTDLARNPGEHWCVMVYENKFDRFFFDSFGHKPSFYGFMAHISQDSPNSICIYNDQVIQHEFSQTCGHHCLFFVYHLCKGLKPAEIIRLYSNRHLRANDYLAFNFVVNRYGENIARY